MPTTDPLLILRIENLPLEPSVAGVTALWVRTVKIQHVGRSELDWLLGAPCPSAGLPCTLGFDTEFVQAGLAVLQLCFFSRVLLIRVPKGSSCPAPQPLVELLSSSTVGKAAAEVWQDALILYSKTGVLMRRGLDLSLAFPGRNGQTQSLFSMFREKYSSSLLQKDHTVDHIKWFAEQLTPTQIKYAALDAFVSYAIAAQSPLQLQRQSAVDLTLARSWELQLAAQCVSVAQRQQNLKQDFKHDFSKVKVGSGGQVDLQQDRFKTRMRHTHSVTITTRNGCQVSARPKEIRGRSASLGDFKDAASGKTYTMSPRSIRSITLDPSRDQGPEEKACNQMLSNLCIGSQTFTASKLVHGLFGGGSLAGDAAGAAAISAALQHRLAISKPRLNSSQASAVEAVLSERCAVTVVQGPPGTGKTKVIAECVEIRTRMPMLQGSSTDVVVCAARSNVAVKNIALALLKRGVPTSQFRLVVSEEYHFEWHEDQYLEGELRKVLITSDKLRTPDVGRSCADIKVFVCTLGMLTSKNFRGELLRGKRLGHLLVDEASQIYAGDLVLPLMTFKDQLRKVAFFGDDQQLPPYGSQDDVHIPSIFDIMLDPTAGQRADPSSKQLPASQPINTGGKKERRKQTKCAAVKSAAAAAEGSSTGRVTGSGKAGRRRPQGTAIRPHIPGRDHGQGSRAFLQVSYRLPAQLCRLISAAMYGGQLQAFVAEAASSPLIWVDVKGSEAFQSGIPSVYNMEEIEAVCGLVKALGCNPSWKAITGYDRQRNRLEQELRTRGLPHQDKVFNVDSFQGREDDVIIASLVRTSGLGFLRDDRRINVMLTRCKVKLIVVGSLPLAMQHPQTLIGKIAMHCQQADLVKTCDRALRNIRDSNAN